MTVSTSPPGAVEEVPAPSGEARRAHEQTAFKKLFARGSAWALINYAVSYGLRLASNFILWRLLSPTAFGLMAIVNVFIQGLSMFSDIGVGQSVVQNERGEDRKFLDTVWTLQVTRGLIVWAVASMAAIPVARFYHQSALAALIPVVAAGTGIAAFNSTNIFTAGRRLALKRLTVVDLSSQFGSMAVMVVWSYLTHSVWGLAVGSVVAALIRLVLSFELLPGVRNRFCWDRTTVQAVAHFGRWIFLSTILTFLSSYSDRLIFGKLVSIDRLGVYSIALVWATFPSYVVSHLASTVLFPLFSRMNEAEGAVPESFRKVRRPVLFAAAWLYACLLAGGPILIRFLYDQRAAEAGLIVQLLAIGSWFSSIEGMNSYSLLALGKPKWLAFGNAAKLVGMVVLLPIGAHLFGFAATVLALSLSELCRYAVSATACVRAGLAPVRQDLRFSVGIAVTGAIGIAARMGYGRLHIHVSNWRLDAFLEGTAVFLLLSAIWFGLFKLGRRQAAPA